VNQKKNGTKFTAIISNRKSAKFRTF